MEKIFFNEGDLVRVKGISGPKMRVGRVVRGRRDGSGSILIGIECLWFIGDVLHEHMFNTKDLEIWV